MTRILKPDSEGIKEAANSINAGLLVVFPTETSYGLAANALDWKAVEKIANVKLSAPDKPIACIVSDEDMLNNLVEGVSELQKKLMKKFWPGPLTILFKARHNIPTQLHGGSGKVGARISSNQLADMMVKEAGTPITATSANLHGGTEPFSIEQIGKELLDKVDIVLDAGKLQYGLTSTFVDVEGPRILREGAIPGKEVLAVLQE